MNDKKWELIVEATAFDGSQTFACEAKDEEEALAKFKAGLCEIIEVNVEVVGLSSIPMDIEESDCIKSRLSGDLNAELTEENKQLREALSELVDGYSSYDLVYSTGLTQERCQKIIDLALNK